jgi:molybdate transport system ATP-binding protein
MLALKASKRLGGFSLDAEVEVRDGSTMALVGESGSGKTTLLRLLAGLIDPDRGHIEVDGEVWFDADTPQRLPASERAVGYVAQDYALFPHLTVAENVAFGLHAQRTTKQATGSRVAATLERLGIGSLARRRPHELSGGQQQRVAIARAIVLEPRALLLDEPLSALDVQTRRAIRGELRRLLAELPCSTVYVTHSPAEALALGAHITVLEGGRVSQQGPREDLMRHPRSAYVAEFLGVNFLRACSAAPDGQPVIRIAHSQGELFLAAPGAESDAALVVHPREITLSLDAPGGSARNVFPGVIEEIVPEPPAGELARVSLASTPPLIAEVTRQAVESLGLHPGMRVFASFKAAGVFVVQ